MNVVCYERVCYERGLLLTWSVLNVVWLCYELSVMNVVWLCYERGLLWTGLLWTGLLWTWSVMNAICYERGLLWTWSVMNVVWLCYECGPGADPRGGDCGDSPLWNLRK